VATTGNGGSDSNTVRLSPFALSLSKAGAWIRGFDKLSPNGFLVLMA